MVGSGWWGGGYLILDTHNWRCGHVHRDSNLEIKKQQMRRPAEDIGETLYVICVTSMGLLGMFMFMAMAMTGEKLRRKDQKRTHSELMLHS